MQNVLPTLIAVVGICALLFPVAMYLDAVRKGFLLLGAALGIVVLATIAWLVGASIAATFWAILPPFGW